MKDSAQRNLVLTPSLSVAAIAGQDGYAPSGGGKIFSAWPVLVLGVAVLCTLVYFYFLYRKSRHRTDELLEENQKLTNLLEERSTQFEETKKELEAFAHSVSHDLRSPLRSIMAFTEILVNEHGAQMNEEGQLYQQRVRANAERLDSFIDGILKYSNLSRQKLNRELVDMAALTTQVVEELGAEIKGREMNIIVEELPAVMADRALLRVVLINLISNAIKFTSVRNPAEILVSHNEDEDKGVYCVQDNGIGLDMKFSETIFQAFQRLHGIDQYEGTGIGLALVQRIISRHGGNVWVESEEGKGARFCFTLGDEE
jgi:light-regulated signal transduction histidine kinase (bacteriophytochrome)